jgi:hypothetical protein
LQTPIVIYGFEGALLDYGEDGKRLRLTLTCQIQSIQTDLFRNDIPGKLGNILQPFS